MGEWYVGQAVVIDRRQIVTVARVTHCGWVVADGRTFWPSGVERTLKPAVGQRSRLTPLTPQLEAEITLCTRSKRAQNDLVEELIRVDKWLRSALPWRDVPVVEDVEKAERLAQAIRATLSE